jgi:alpha-L-arabinofuranosidase
MRKITTLLAALLMAAAVAQKRIVMIIVNEWRARYEVEPGANFGLLCQQNSLRDALVVAIKSSIFNQHCKRVKMPKIANEKRPPTNNSHGQKDDRHDD